MAFRLRNKLLLFGIAAAILPLGSAMSFSILRFRTVQTNAALERESQIARVASQEVLNFITSQFERVREGTLIYPEVLTDPELRDIFLERILFRSSDFMDVALVDKNGEEIARENRILVIPSTDLINRSKTEEFLATKKQGYYVGPIFFESGRPFFNIGVASYSVEKEFRGAVFAQIDARIMQKVVQDTFAVKEGGGRVYIVNTKGTIVAHPDISQVLSEKDFSEIPIVNALLRDPISPLEKPYENELGQEVLGAWSPINTDFIENGQTEARWYVVSENPASFALRHVTEIFWLTIGFFVLVFMAAILAALFFSRLIIRPIEKVRHATIQFAKGNLEYRVSVKTNDEIEDLAGGFNKMAKELHQSILSLEKEKAITLGERNKLSLILSGISNAVIAVDLDRNVVLFNVAAESLLKYSSKKAFGKRIDKIIRVWKDEKEIKMVEYCPVKEGSGDRIGFHENNVTMRSVNNHETVVNLISGNIKEAKIANIGCILTIQDVSEQRRFERLKTQFVSIAAHQLRTPLTGIKWSMASLIDEGIKKLTIRQKKLIDDVNRENDRMIRLVGDLLDTAKIEEGKYVQELSEADIVWELQDVIDRHRELIKGKKLQIRFIYPKTPFPKIRVDIGKIKLAFQNILANAITYTPSEGSIEVSIKKKDSTVEVYVKDTGIGILEKDKKRIFSRFFRSEEAVAIKTDGSGLGLFIVKNIIEAHGGKIWFESKAGKGTTFYFIIPIKDIPKKQ
ncbi:MAG: ATP-binding protein [Patescibacteria group bacterium]|nr:ATP-binding protein [Patescibacteria group bacterium]